MFEPSQKQFYEANGYLVVPSVLTPDDLAGVVRRTTEIVADPAAAPAGVKIAREGDTVRDKTHPDAANSSVRAISFMARFDPEFQQVARHPRLLELVHGLIGPRVKVFRDQMLLKPPGGQAKPVHQDQSYFRVQPPDALMTAWIALDEATLQNGCMVYVPGSHRHGLFEVEADPDRPVHHRPRAEGIDLEDEVGCPVPAGSVIFHHACTLHRSEINQTTAWRRALILHYAASDARSEVEQLNQEVSLEID